MSLKDITPQDFAEIELLHARTRQPLGIFITVYGTDSTIWQQALNKMRNRNNEKKAKSRNQKWEPTAEESTADYIELIAAATKSWRTGNKPEIEIDDGVWVPCTRENAAALYRDFPWIRVQIDEEIGDRSNFLPE